MSARVIPLPGWAVHIWETWDGMFGVLARRQPIDLDFPPEDAPLLESRDEAVDLALSIRGRTGFPVVSHVGDL